MSLEESVARVNAGSRHHRVVELDAVSTTNDNLDRFPSNFAALGPLFGIHGHDPHGSGLMWLASNDGDLSSFHRFRKDNVIRTGPAARTTRRTPGSIMRPFACEKYQYACASHVA
jgi:hypothetical protein